MGCPLSGDNREDLVEVSPPEWLEATARLLERLYDPRDVHCRCAPAFGEIDEETGIATCDACGLTMLASTVGEFVRRHQAAQCS